MGICGPLDLDQIGILADISRLLAEVHVTIFVVSTYDTDIVLIKQCHLTSAINALRSAGHVVREQ